MLVAKIGKDDTLEFVSGKFEQDRNVTIEAQMEAGDYLVLVEVDWMQSLNRQIVISRRRS